MENTIEDKTKTTISNSIVEQNNYHWGLDLIRVIAMFFVILVHSTSFYGFLDVEISSFGLFCAGIGRFLSYTCIPLFLLLTGYLNSNKTPIVKYYLKLIKILIEFVICGVIIALITKFCFDNTSSLLKIGNITLLFKIPSYNWYINMFIGLFLLIPFLNYLYKSIPNKQKWLFIITLIILFSNPQVSTYWTSAYPIMYYYVGSFLKDKQFKVNKLILLLIIILMSVIQTIISRLNIPLYSTENHNNFGCFIISVSIFLLFYNLKISTLSKYKMKICKVLRIIANASLSTFLISEIFETLTKKLFTNLAITSFTDKMPYLLYLTPLKFVLSIICGIAISLLSSRLYNLILNMINKKSVKQAK